jgi:hypothetical protein
VARSAILYIFTHLARIADSSASGNVASIKSIHRDIDASRIGQTSSLQPELDGLRADSRGAPRGEALVLAPSADLRVKTFTEGENHGGSTSRVLAYDEANAASRATDAKAKQARVRRASLS